LSQIPPVNNDGTDIGGALEIARRDLLDLGLRNTLLSYRPLRSKGAEVIDGRPVEVFRLLVKEERSLTFLPGKAGGLFADVAADDDHTAQPGDGRDDAARHKGLRLQTAYPSVQLQARLLATYHAARTSMEEQGVNTLYLALGMLSWREGENSEEYCRAPLIMIPVELGRSDARDRFHLKYTSEELGENVSLAEKLKQSFGIRNFPEMPDPDDLDVADYFKKVQLAVRSRSGWAVDARAIVLGFFSFAKFLMYRDLDPTTWPSSDAILGHGVLQSLLSEEGFQPFSSNYREDSLLDEQLQNRDILNVVDSDSSQAIAILDCLDGHNMVIQGPPGTGKSQTIVNLIAGAVAGGKRVLFVSEKMAALDVVKRRLDHVRLGAACLELHSNRTNKKTIIEELRRTATGERLALPQSRAELSLLGDSRNRLNAYCKAVNEPIGSSGENPCTAYGRLLNAQAALKGLDLPALPLEGAADWTAEDVARRTQLVVQFQDRLTRSGAAARHPFWGSQLKVLLPTDRDDIRDCATSAGSACAVLERAANSLAQAFSVEFPNTERKVDLLSKSAHYMVGAPDLAGVALSSPGWLSREQQIRKALAAGRRHRDIHRQYDADLRPEAWGIDTSDLRHNVAELGSRWWRFLSTRWRNARKSLVAMRTGVAPLDQASQLALLDAVAGAAQSAQAIASAGECMAGLLGPAWRGPDSEWDLIERQAEWVIGAQKGIHEGNLAAWCIEPSQIAVDPPTACVRLEELARAREIYQIAVRSWADRLLVDESRFPDGPLAGQPFSTLQARWDSQNSRVDELHALVAFNQISAECETEGIRGVASVAAIWEPASALLLHLYERARLSALLARAFNERPALATFDGVRHSSTVAEFRRLDLLQLAYNRALLTAKHAQSLPSGGGAGEIGILYREFEKRARFLPIRSLMLKAGHAIQSIKPVFMMSPLSIANYLPPGGLTFDLVVFDEASQVKPVDAFGAIARGQQVVVVGDSKQLPPTSFFDSLVSSDDAEPEDEATPASDIESVLGMFCARGAHQRMLRWHYRSRHESLITVSNHLFYQDRLVVFPSPDRDRKKLGLVYRRLQNAPYDRSRTRTNPLEAKAVAIAVMAHAKNQLQLPRDERETLGVAAFSVAQMDAILNHVELMRRQDSSCEEFFSYPPHEPFFVKNLENVQGDERDVMFISVGYGRTVEGYLAMNFGPLTRTGGERRLNVLISRARRRCEVFTTLSADDLDLSKTSSAGVVALKTFLSYAQSGQMDLPAPAERPPDSDFEEQVLRQLTALGHTVHTQVGSAGFFLDLAVVDPVNPGRYLLGIECDGARYHSARSARDRDRLRQSVLEGLGWRIHRIWSTDWFHNPEEELRKVVQAIETARIAGPPAAVPEPRPEAAEGPVQPRPSAVQATSQNRPAAPYKCAQVSFRLGDVDMHLVGRSQLADLLAQVVSVESPVHWTEATRRILSGAGIQRLGNRIQQAFEEAIRLGVSRGLFAKRQGFLWEPAMKEPPVRDRSELPAGSRKLEFVAPEEIRRAILIVVEAGCGIVPEGVPNAVCRLLGFSRVTDEMNLEVRPHRDALIREGYLAVEGVNLILAEPARGADADGGISG
jgi:very-short-patch-repair endonuclease